jgi:hypothetical protein
MRFPRLVFRRPRLVEYSFVDEEFVVYREF